jgi:FkbM family methyltransferase
VRVPRTRYELERALLAPWRAYRRRREPTQDKLARSMLELHSYRRPLYAFMAASAEDPDLLFDADLRADSVVLDVGAYDGAWAQGVVDRSGARVYAFEPDPTSLRKLHARFPAGGRVAVLDYGLAGCDRRVDLGLAGPGSSVYEPDGMFGTARVELRDVVGVLDGLGLDTVDLLKVNIEGGEYELFDRLIAAGRLDRMRHVSVQFHEWHPKAHARRAAIRRALRVGHEEVWCYPWIWELWRVREAV